ncbi:TDP-fucosamine acetyltransferase [Tritonibacter multivorans]|uniref:TDP-fucosamine acetyltransferase n=1 Tax=Tritonibacter multivorans TaxID=928856 RepID=A0A0P1GJ77_9RHOB|nr:hypothetical protein [Tritonibacter multivorans]MDA7422201.1 hypothetical protein [Tritonibacter multivorans]CUH74798.1 TDP-fucosamine acetyltransferase [Tritonibacter multivorans]SFD80029.1 hypothetical protein SAMN04488049_1335 [Tritonibacter multivorans]
MKIIEAVWEKRNLGLDVLEVELGSDDCPTDVVTALENLPAADYVSVKVPAGNVALTNAIEDIGFRFREMLSTVEVVNLPDLDRIMSRYAQHMSTGPAADHEIEEIFDHIRDGMFTTDRFSLDPAFSAVQSSSRYCGWISDEVARGAELQSIAFKGKFVGFFLVRDAGGGRFHSLLAGIFPAFQHMGLGYFINHMAYVHCFEKGAKTVSTTFSSNNLGASNIHNIISTRLTSQCYVFSKHLK